MRSQGSADPGMSVLPIRFDEVRDWLFGTALPYWAEAGVDRVNGGFVEHLDLTGRDGGAAFKRTRAQARQIYCFSHAALLGWEPGRDIAEHGWRFLMAHGRRQDGAWVRRMGRDGGVIDPTSDAYDLAFVLFAHAWRHRLTGDPAIVDQALATADALDQTLGHADKLGWRAAEDAPRSRVQNPHMHIVEAAIELAETTGHARFRALVDQILSLFREHLFDEELGVLREYYGDGWTRLDGSEGRLVEPGHLLEWSWLLYRAKRLLGVDHHGAALRLFHTVQAMGLAPDTLLVVDQVDDRGKVLDAGSRCWPQTEALKANLAVLEHEGLDRRPQIARCVDNLLDRYLTAEPPGTWIDQFDEFGAPRVDKIPSTTFYHLFLAFSELLRLRPVIEDMAEKV